MFFVEGKGNLSLKLKAMKELKRIYKVIKTENVSKVHAKEDIFVCLCVCGTGAARLLQLWSSAPGLLAVGGPHLWLVYVSTN